MNKIIAWLVGMTKVGKVLESTRKALDGKKQMIASLGAAIPATLMIITKFQEQGTQYLVGLSATPEFATFSLGWVGFFNALKGEKIRAENAQIIEGQKQEEVAKEETPE